MQKKTAKNFAALFMVNSFGNTYSVSPGYLFAPNRSTVRELPANERLILVPLKWTASVLGETFAGSGSEFSSARLSDVRTGGVPWRSTSRRQRSVPFPAARLRRSP